VPGAVARRRIGCKDAPFSKEVPDADLWLPSSKLVIVDALLDALDERASVVLVGEPGVGKTCVLRALRHRIPAAGYKLTYCHNATLGRRDFYRQLCHAVGLSPAAMSRSLLNLGDGRGGDHYAAFDFDATGAMEFSCCASARIS